ncbi:hypothetical protein OF376_01695 [Ureaplasma miroungigenitalium]|uniref:NAD(+) kinase n=1 Tax=Ureaplasma miroungigenitalium TaxID=1042321 RepID=A0ABT3BML2_9BACT|nr:hypothetical protein [Ureaplasma miroungigenitalium]MCV3728478.1 hypothetical protein [Ureaplasma miroungigenitalium]MCV3734265.1 hypothetical protein [Ureaplasma miroungigenitalium]
MIFNYTILCSKKCDDRVIHNELHQRLNSNPSYQFKYQQDDLSYLFVLGGDGTFINQLKPYISSTKPLRVIMINFGSLGFNASYEKIEDIVIEDIVNVNFFQPINVLETIVNEEVRVHSINELMLWTPKIMRLDVSINKNHLEYFKGSGIIVSTQIGSSATNKSNNGAIIIENQNVYQYSKVLPWNVKHNISLQNPLILHLDHMLEFQNLNHEEPFEIINDGQKVEISSKIKHILSKLIPTNLLIFNEHRLISYITALRKAFIKD